MKGVFKILITESWIGCCVQLEKQIREVSKHFSVSRDNSGQISKSTVTLSPESFSVSNV